MPPKLIKHLIIVGHQKCGTTAVYNILKQTGRFSVSSKKELNYFFRKNVSLEDYLTYFDDVHKVTLEASPYYIFNPKAIEKIQKTLGPHVRLLVLRRDPVERAISHYQHSVIRGFEKRELMDAMYDDAHSLSLNEYKLKHNSYIKRSRYKTLEDKLFEIFDYNHENISVLNFDRDIQKSLLDFSILTQNDIKNIKLKRKNESYVVKNKILFRIIRHTGLRGQNLLRLCIILRIIVRGKYKVAQSEKEQILNLIQDYDRTGNNPNSALQ